MQRDRLTALIEFAQQSARLRGRPVASVGEHRIFALYEHEVQGLPGVRLNRSESGDEDDEIWLSVARLIDRTPPEIASAWLRPWVDLTPDPTVEPLLRESIRGSLLIEAGTHTPPTAEDLSVQPVIEPLIDVSLADYEFAAEVRSLYGAYLTTRWRPWATDERPRRETSRLYARLFTLRQQLEGGIVESQLELVWGVGVAVLSAGESSVCYPLVGCLVELTLNAESAEMEVRPRDVDPRIEIDWFVSQDNPGVSEFERSAAAFFEKATQTFSPFERPTYEPLLIAGATLLDANGAYWPAVTAPDNRTLPAADEKLKVTDTWVLFARPRTNNLLLQDLEKLKLQVEATETFPPAVAAIVTEPGTANPVLELPPFRGVSAAGDTEGGVPSRDLFFPKPFNEEQVRIVQLLEVSDGVVVQGPPGTGKTHTIANVICHYLAEGKRVLVTSMKDPALTEVRDKLPEEIRPLAISLLSSERDGMKQFEYAIHKIASEVQSLDRGGTSREIVRLEGTIDSLHGTLAQIDHQIEAWAARNLSKIVLDSEEIDPQDAAREVVEYEEQMQWLADPLGVGPQFSPRHSDTDVSRLRQARAALGEDLRYLGAKLPRLSEFPDLRALLEVHQDLTRVEKLKAAVENGDIPPLADSGQETLQFAEKLLGDVEAWVALRDELTRSAQPWTDTVRDRLRGGGDTSLFPLVDAIGEELERAFEQRRPFIERPVTAPPGAELDTGLLKAVENLAEGKRPFGLAGLIGKSEEKEQLAQFRVLGRSPEGNESWLHVARYLALLGSLRALVIRWNAVAGELALPSASNGVEAGQHYAEFLKVKSMAALEAAILETTDRVFPTWPARRDTLERPEHPAELETALRHHLTQDRLANIWATKEQFQRVLEGCSGPVVDEFRRFFGNAVGNPAVSDAEMQAQWSALTAELQRVTALGPDLSVVEEVCGMIAASGAPLYADTLRSTPLVSVIDTLLPENWRQCWRIRRLATHLDSIDGREEWTSLAKSRRDFGGDLARAYGEIVGKRTWLKLAESASDDVRSALAAYLTAIQRIGKGTGKRAVRYRQDARIAATLANPAIPCWIMAHYRVSESLPADLGCFDLVIIDEASQSDLTALPALLRATKVLIVGDDKQVSPEGIGLDEEKVRNLMGRFLGNQVTIFRQQMSPDRSIYDLYKVAFAKSAVMLKEHFRSVAPIIEYSKREFYNHELRPLRLPTSSERLDPPLIDVVVEDGYRTGDINRQEARFIIDEIGRIVSDPAMAHRSIGVVSLLANKQAQYVWDRLMEELGQELVERHRITVGDARTFQGKERDIMFLSMVSAPNDVGAPLSRDTFAQRFNVAASRARDRMYLVRSVRSEQLSSADRLRRSLIEHFSSPFTQDERPEKELRSLCESPFERELYDELVQRGYRVSPQVRVGQDRIDLVIEGRSDARLAIECDGDQYLGTETWADDMRRQRVLERAGWVFWRCFAANFIRRRSAMMDDLTNTLAERGIEPVGADPLARIASTEHRVVTIGRHV